jgi:hypothetical protein
VEERLIVLKSLRKLDATKVEPATTFRPQQKPGNKNEK